MRSASRFGALLFLLAAGCHHGASMVLATKVIGAGGGHIEGGGAALDIPAGALPGNTTISILLSNTAPPGLTTHSPVYHFEPDGLAFAQPIAVKVAAAGRGPGAVLMWTKADNPSIFEFAGFVENGSASANVAHFSEGVIADANGCMGGDAGITDDDCENAAEDAPACADATPGCGGACGSDVAGAANDNGYEPCRDLCRCMPGDGVNNSIPMCTDNPLDAINADTNGADCLPTNSKIPGNLVDNSGPRPAAGSDYLAKREAEACVGYAVREVDLVKCQCVTAPPNNYTLCHSGRFVNTAPPGSYSWRCVSDINGDVPNVSKNGTVLNDVAPSYTGTSGAPCTGQYIDPSNTPGGPVAASGTLQSCDSLPSKVGVRWQEVAGTIARCGPLEWANGRPSGVAIVNEQCRLSDHEWAMLSSLRANCGLSARMVDAGDPLGWQRGEGQTLAIVVPGSATGMPQFSPIVGVNGVSPNGKAQAARLANASGRCPMSLGRDFPTGSGMSVGYAKKGQGYTHCHAEGDALEQLAAHVTKVAPPTGDRPPDTVGDGGGAAVMFVDRAPCRAACAGYGIDRMRRMAGLKKLVVRSPAHAYCFADGLPESGQIVDSLLAEAQLCGP